MFNIIKKTCVVYEFRQIDYKNSDWLISPTCNVKFYNSKM